MFELTNESSAKDTEQQRQAVAQHVQTIFSNAKALADSYDGIRQAEEQKRGSSRRWHDLEIPGLRENKQSYTDNMSALETDGVSISELYLSTIQAQKAEVESRLEGFAQHQANLHTKLNELAALESALNNQSGKYSKLLAQGDIAAADALEEERLGNLQATRNERDEIEHKLAASDKAESILKKDIGIYRAMFIKAHRNLLMQKYNEVLLPTFRQQFGAFAETFTEMNRIMGKINTSKYAEWEHWAMVHELLEKKGHNFIDHERAKEQQYYQSLR